MLQSKKIVFIALALAAALAYSAPQSGLGGTTVAGDPNGDYYARLAAYNNDLILAVLAQPDLEVRPVAPSREQGVASLVFWLRAGLPPSAYADANPYADRKSVV